MYALHTLAESLHLITLPKPGLPAPWGIPSNVYLWTRPEPALLGCGHPLSWPALQAALAQLGLSPAQITRVVALDWSFDQLGNAHRFPQAALLALSPDMVQPSDYAALVAEESRWWRRAAQELMTLPDYAQAMDAASFAEQLALWCAGLPQALELLPLREGHQVHLGGERWQVLQTAGPAPGHLSLYSPQSRWLFSGRLATERAFGDLQVHQVRPMLQSIERTFDLHPTWSLPTLGLPREDGLQHLRRANKRLVSLLNHLPFVLQGTLTLPAVVRRDLGYVPSQMARFLGSVRFYQGCFDELVRSGATRRQGQGLLARYGAGAPDPRLAPG